MFVQQRHKEGSAKKFKLDILEQKHLWFNPMKALRVFVMWQMGD